MSQNSIGLQGPVIANAEIGEELQYFETQPTQIKRQRQLAIAAKLLLLDYTNDGELTVFTVLDTEPLCE